MTVAAAVTARPPAAVVVAALDLLTARERHADELAFACAALLTQLGGRDVLAATHWAALGQHRHVALALEVTSLDATDVAEALNGIAGHGNTDDHGLLVGGTFSGPAGLQSVLEETLDAHRARTSGRVVAFPGSTTLTGTLTVDDVVASTRIDRVRVIGSPEPKGDTRGAARDCWTGASAAWVSEPPGKSGGTWCRP